MVALHCLCSLHCLCAYDIYYNYIYKIRHLIVRISTTIIYIYLFIYFLKYLLLFFIYVYIYYFYLFIDASQQSNLTGFIILSIIGLLLNIDIIRIFRSNQSQNSTILHLILYNCFVYNYTHM